MNDIYIKGARKKSMSVVYLLQGTSSRELDKDRKEDVFDDELRVVMGSFWSFILLPCIKVHARQFSKIWFCNYSASGPQLYPNLNNPHLSQQLSQNHRIHLVKHKWSLFFKVSTFCLSCLSLCAAFSMLSVCALYYLSLSSSKTKTFRCCQQWCRKDLKKALAPLERLQEPRICYRRNGTLEPTSAHIQVFRSPPGFRQTCLSENQGCW